MRYDKNILGLLSLAILAACGTDDNSSSQPQVEALKLTSSVEDFIGEAPSSRVNSEGTAFEENDLIRIKVICPYVTSTEYGETTWSNSYDGFWFQRWSGSAWTSVPSSMGFDIDGDYQASNAPSLVGQYLVQQTPYVFTASTWTEEKSFVTNGKLAIQYANVFHADQSNVKNYKASDVLWAQTIMQTGTDEVHLAFQHVMVGLTITMGEGVSLSDNAVVTVEGMPDIDEAEIIVGDKYASYSKVNSTCGYKEKHQASDDKNGKVLGIGVNNDAAGTSSCKAMADISQTATYKAYRKANGVYRLILPPCTLTNNAIVWVRDGEKRWSVSLSRKEFEQGKMYNVTLNLQTSTVEED